MVLKGFLGVARAIQPWASVEVGVTMPQPGLDKNCGVWNQFLGATQRAPGRCDHLATRTQQKWPGSEAINWLKHQSYGWNAVCYHRGSPLLKGLRGGARDVQPLANVDVDVTISEPGLIQKWPGS
uniref:Uncharacterized protein n=1 Tax=Romanomermis culicivorax TaxID=13658 RepID=A0A915KJS3_ROMCU